MRVGRQAPQNLGPVPTEPETVPPEPQASAEAQARTQPDLQASSGDWLDAIIDNKWMEAIPLLEREIAKTTDDNQRQDLNSWLGRAKYNLNPREGTEFLENFIAQAPERFDGYWMLAYGHYDRGLIPDALEVIDRGIQNAGPLSTLIIAKTTFLKDAGREKEIEPAIQAAIDSNPDDLELHLLLARHYHEIKDNDRARKVLEDLDQQFPNRPSVLNLYARVLEPFGDRSLQLVPYAQLTKLEPRSPEHLGLRGNVLVDLGLFDLALEDYEKASELAAHKQDWLLSNIGNVLRVKGLPRKAIEFLKRALELKPESEYALTRLAESIKARDHEDQKYAELLAEARKKLLAVKLAREETQGAVDTKQPQ